MSIMSGVFRLGQDAETRYLPSGEAVMNLSLASNYGKKDPNTGHRPTQWIDAGLWGSRAESLAQYMLKGTVIFAVLEDVHMGSYTKGDGTTKWKLVARVASVEFVPGAKRDDQGDAPRQQASRPAPSPAAPASRPAPAPRSAGGSGFDDMDDDIPF